MEDIKIIVEDKVASVVGMPSIICGNNDYTLSFTFDDEWNDEQNKVARFKYKKDGIKKFIDVPIKDNTCQVPKLLGIGLVRVGVYAGDLKTTTGAKIKCDKSILCDGVEETTEAFKNLYDEAMEQIKEVADTVKAELEPNTIKNIDVVDLSTCESGIYLVHTIRYRKPFLPQPFTEVIPVKALLIVVKNEIGIYFQWIGASYTLQGLSNAKGEFAEGFTKYDFTGFASTYALDTFKSDLQTEIQNIKVEIQGDLDIISTLVGGAE